MKESYACVCVREFPLQALLRLRPDRRKHACVVMEGDPPFEQVCSLNRSARALGLAGGMTRVEVETFPQITMLSRSVSEENATKAVLLECAAGFSPRVEECSGQSVFLCVIDLAGTERLFGTAETLAKKLLRRMQDRGVVSRIAVSSNFYAAVAAAKSFIGGSAICVIPHGEERAALSSLPLIGLDLAEGQAEIFSLWGIRTLGMLAELPERELIARMGKVGNRLRRLARGELPHLFQPIEPVFALTERMELESPVEALDSLLFVANAMLEQLIQRAGERALSLASVSIWLKLEGGYEHTRTVRPALPANDRRLWIKLLHLDLEAHPPPAAVVGVTLQAEPGSRSKVQLGIFSPQLPESARLDVTLARIRAIVGEENVGRAVLQDRHGWDAFRIEPFEVSSERSAEFASAAIRPALRCIRPAETISMLVQKNVPRSFVFRQRRYAVERAYGPWLLAVEWWKPTWQRCAQWDVTARAQDGTELCCCIVHDVRHGGWKMTALYD